ncbi:GDSL-type esterase/lipase family protein [Jiulongibacter sp. NS-SX5]|uniref:GDSL-type esterase/lipase family protein n=1 Tax=Jiulongibacter sp. NS-SX5 TaxID=3463854 RepID=UPI004058413F
MRLLVIAVLLAASLSTQAQEKNTKPKYSDYEIESAMRKTQDYGYLSKYQEANAALHGEPQKVVFLGNSITEGWYRVRPEFFNENEFVGRGISGQTSSQLLIRFRQDVVNLKPEKVIIHIGTNDIAENTGPYVLENTVNNIASMVDIAVQNDIEVLLASVLPATKFSWRMKLGDRSAQIVELNEHLQKMAQERGLKYIDYHTAMKNPANGLDEEIAKDGVHPTLKGYAIMENVVLEALR